MIGAVTGAGADECGRVTFAGYAPTGFDADGAELGPGLFAAQLDPAGDVRWARLLWGPSVPWSPSGNPLSQLVALATDPAGGVAVAGWITSAYLIDGLTAGSPGGPDVVVLALDGDGHARWLRSFGTTDVDWATGVASNAGGRVAVVGEQGGGLDAGGGPLAGGGFVAVFSTAGEPMWSHGFGNDNVHPHSVAMSQDGDVYVVGSFSASLTIAGGPVLVAAGTSHDAFAVRLSPDGQHVWSARWGDDETQRARRVAARPGGGIVLVGEMQPNSSTDFGGGPLHAPTLLQWTQFFVALDSDGKHVLSESIALAEAKAQKELAVGPDGTAVLAIETSPTTVLRIAATGEVIDTMETCLPTPVVARVPAGTVVANTSYGSCSVGPLSTTENSLSVVRLCDEP
jgi:hypothetical protein